MRTKVMGIVGSFAVGVFAISAVAFCPKDDAKAAGDKPSCSGAKVVTASDHAGCSAHKEGCGKDCACAGNKAILASSNPLADEVFASLPTMKYKVGDVVTGCEKSAGGMAEKTHQPLQYVVGDETFENHSDAIIKLTSLLEEELNNMQAMQFAVGGDCTRCPVTAKSMAEKAHKTMKYRVAGIDFDSKEQAEKAIELVSSAVNEVKMGYDVDGKSFCCDQMAGMQAKKTGKPMTYVVGETKTSCDKHAKLLLTQAKVHAAVEAAAQLHS